MSDWEKRRRERRAAMLADKLAKNPGYVACPQCNGVGDWPELTRMVCPRCDRQGIVPASSLDPSPSDSLTVRIDDAGAAHLLAVDDDGGCGITVPRERRILFALEVVGDVTEEMIEDGAKRRVAELGEYTWEETEGNDEVRNMWRRITRIAMTETLKEFRRVFGA